MSLFVSFLSYFLRQFLSLILGIAILARLTGQSVDLLVSASAVLGLQTHVTMPIFNLGFGDPDSGLLACAPSTLLTEPPPQPQDPKFFLLIPTLS